MQNGTEQALHLVFINWSEETGTRILQFLIYSPAHKWSWLLRLIDLGADWGWSILCLHLFVTFESSDQWLHRQTSSVVHHINAQRLNWKFSWILSKENLRHQRIIKMVNYFYAHKLIKYKSCQVKCDGLPSSTFGFMGKVVFDTLDQERPILASWVFLYSFVCVTYLQNLENVENMHNWIALPVLRHPVYKIW